jgi:hypothetical protein
LVNGFGYAGYAIGVIGGYNRFVAVVVFYLLLCFKGGASIAGAAGSVASGGQ